MCAFILTLFPCKTFFSSWRMRKDSSDWSRTAALLLFPPFPVQDRSFKGRADASRMAPLSVAPCPIWKYQQKRELNSVRNLYWFMSAVIHKRLMGAVSWKLSTLGDWLWNSDHQMKLSAFSLVLGSTKVNKELGRQGKDGENNFPWATGYSHTRDVECSCLFASGTRCLYVQLIYLDHLVLFYKATFHIVSLSLSWCMCFSISAVGFCICLSWTLWLSQFLQFPVVPLQKVWPPASQHSAQFDIIYKHPEGTTC